MKSAITHVTRKNFLELSNLTTNRKLYNMYVDLYIKSCKKEMKKTAARTTALGA